MVFDGAVPREVGAEPRGIGATGPTLSPSSSWSVLYPEGSVLTAGRPRSCTPRDRFCGPYNIAIAIVIAIVIVASAVPRGVGADGRAAAVLYPEGSVLRALHYRHRHHGQCCTPRGRRANDVPGSLGSARVCRRANDLLGALGSGIAHATSSCGFTSGKRKQYEGK